MSSFKGHLIGVFILDIVIISLIFFGSKYFNFNISGLVYQNYQSLIIMLLLSFIFSLFPDIDTNSVGSHIFYTAFIVLDIYLMVMKKFVYASILGLLAMFPAMSKHRGFMHSKIFAVIICSPFLWVPMFYYNNFTLIGVPYFSAALIGYFSHLLFDGKLI